MKIKSNELILFGMFGALIAAAQMALSFLPNIELVTLFIIIFSLIYGRKALYIVFVFIILMGLLHGFGTWWIGYVILWPLLSLITLLLKKWIIKRYLILAIYSGIFGLLFGLFYAIPYAVFGGINAGIVYWVSGIPYDIIHGVGNYFLMLLLGKKIFDIVNRLNKSYFHGN